MTKDGGASQGVADLWCTYAATRTLTWLNAAPTDPTGCAAFLLSCRNGDGGYGWRGGLRSDMWATYYCTQTLKDLGVEIPYQEQLAAWLDKLRSPEGGFRMTPGQPADIWATYYAVRTYREILGSTPPDSAAVMRWLASLQLPNGGLGWAPGSRTADTRAGYYGALAWHYLQIPWQQDSGWDTARLVAWMQGRQMRQGGFVFHEGQTEPCLWATFRAVRALTALGGKPADESTCQSWIKDRLLPESGFSRWEGYPIADVWACFSAVGSLEALNHPLDKPEKEQVAGFLRSCQLPNTGFTYREPEQAGDGLATAATLMVGVSGNRTIPERQQLASWLQRAHMPYEGGVMYMPARGAEVRSTLWALAALSLVGGPPLDPERLARWFATMQNPDGGFGYWQGRGSDMTATTSALECLFHLGPESWVHVDRQAAAGFVISCMGEAGVRFAPGGEFSVTTTCMGARALHLTGESAMAGALVPLILGHRSRLGGYGIKPGGFPDLISTYQAVLTLQVLSEPWDAPDLLRFLDRVRTPKGGFSWSPFSREESGPLATCLGYLLEEAATASEAGREFTLPRLNL